MTILSDEAKKKRDEVVSKYDDGDTSPVKLEFMYELGYAQAMSERNDNCISLSLHESRMKYRDEKLKSDLAEAVKYIKTLEPSVLAINHRTERNNLLRKLTNEDCHNVAKETLKKLGVEC